MNKKLIQKVIFKGTAIVEPDFHDGRVTSVSIGQHLISIGITSVNGEDYLINLLNVDQFKADDFRQGNIILNVSVALADFDKDPHLLGLYGLTFPSEKPFFKELIKNLEAKAKKLFSIVPSYGCEITAICKEIEICKACCVPVN